MKRKGDLNRLYINLGLGYYQKQAIIFELAMRTDSVQYRASLHWVTFLPSVMFLALAIPLFFVTNIPTIVPLSLLGFFCLGFFIQYLTLKTAYLDVFEDKVCLLRGIISHNETSVPLKRIESVDIKQTLFGCLFNYGTIILTGSGGSHYLMHKISEPLTCRRKIEQQLFLSSS